MDSKFKLAATAAATGSDAPRPSVALPFRSIEDLIAEVETQERKLDTTVQRLAADERRNAS